MGFLFGGKGTTTRADKISDFQINTASYGETVPEVLGTTRLSGNIIDWDDFTAHEHKERQRTGKGGGPKNTNITYTYSVAVAIGLCEGPIAGIGKVWRDKEIFNYPSDELQLTLYRGDTAQAPWPYMLGKHPNKALPYSGLAYMAGVVDLGDRGSLPNYNFEIKGKLLSTGDGVDVNPADYVLHILDRVGIDRNSVDGIDNFRNYCREADILISSPPDGKATKAQQIIADIAEITNSYLFWSSNRLKIVPLADKPIGNWDPHATIQYNLTADDFLPSTDGRLVEYKRKTSTESYNQATVEFLNRANGYEKESVSFEVVADVQKNGLRPASKKTAHYLYTKKRAMYFAEQLAMKRLYERNQYTFKLDWAFCRLEPGDLVTITDDVLKVNRQVVVITDVQESDSGDLTIMAIGKPPGVYAPAVHDVHETERPMTDFNAPAKPVLDVTFIQPPVDATKEGLELWLAVTGPSEWGGCNVWVSDNDESYRLLGRVYNSARTGTLLNAMNSTATTANVRMASGQLKSGTCIDAERGNTLCYVDGELLSYETAQLQPNGTYSLGGLVRGQYNSTKGAHGANTKFVRIDESILRHTLRNEDIGKTVYVKCTSFNIFGAQEEDISRVRRYSHTIQSYYIPTITNLALSTLYRAVSNKEVSYDLIATFSPPNFQSYGLCEAWYREQGTSDWHYGGNGDGRIVISGCQLGVTYEVIVKVKDIHGNYSQGVTSQKLIEMKAEKPNTPEGISMTFGKLVEFHWREVTNADVDFYEVRTNRDPGNANGLIARSTNTTAQGWLTERQGTVYVYAHNPSRGYSAPSAFTYNKPLPPRPTQTTARADLAGINVYVGTIPPDCRRANVYINNATYFMEGGAFYMPLQAGIYSVSTSFVDVFGEGPRSEEIAVTVKAYIDPKLIDQERLGITKVNEFIDGFDEKVASTVNPFIASVTDDVNKVKSQLTVLNGAVSSSVATANGVSSRITQLADDINLRIESKADKSKIISQINLSKEVATIDGRLTHITGDTLIDNNVIVGKHLQAGSISADKLAAGTINLGDNEIGIQGGGVRLDAHGMTISGRGGTHTKIGKDGIVWHDSYGNPFGAVRRMVKGLAKHGDRINLHWDSIPYVIVTPVDYNIASNLMGTSSFSASTVCRAKDITKEGFTIEAYSARSGDNSKCYYTNAYHSKGKLVSTKLYAYVESPLTVELKYLDGLEVYVNYKALSNTTGSFKPYNRGKYPKEEEPYRSSDEKGDIYRTGSGTVYIAPQLWDLNKAPTKSTPVTLKKGVNVIECVYLEEYIPPNIWTRALVWLDKHPSIEFIKPHEGTVHFIAMDAPNEGHYTITRHDFKVTTFKGRGVKTYRPSGRRMKVILIGASSDASKSRPSSAETKITGNGLNLTTSRTLSEMAGIPNRERYSQRLKGYQPSHKREEIPEENFWMVYLGVASTFREDTQVDKLTANGHTLTDPPIALQANYNNSTSIVKSFRWTGNWFMEDMKDYGDLSFGVGQPMVGVACPLQFIKHKYHTPHKYAREAEHEIVWGMGISEPVIYEFSIPSSTPIGDFTITIGACPDVKRGDVWPMKSTQNGVPNTDTSLGIEVLDTTIFDGGCVIIEEV